jgi:hypothetical protein
MGLIPQKIETQAFELIRNRIGEIIADELYQQAAINYTDDLDATVWVERFVPFQFSEIRHGAINVTYDGTNYDAETQQSATGICNFSIDFYMAAKSGPDSDGDKRSRARQVGVVRAILMDSRYKTLAFATPFIWNRRVVDIKVGDPVNAQDGTSSIMARIMFAVKVSENVDLVSVRTIDSYVTQAVLNDTDLGYLYGELPAPDVEPVCPGVSILINSVDFADVNSGATFNITLIDTDGNPVAATVSGNNIIVPNSGSSMAEIENSNQTFTASFDTADNPFVLPATSVQLVVSGTPQGLPQNIVTLDPNAVVNIPW